MFTARKTKRKTNQNLRGLAMKILKFAVKPKSSIQQHLWDILALKNKIYISKELSPITQSLT